MSLLLYSSLSRNRGGLKLDKVSKEEASSFNKISAFVILVQVLLWVYFITKGVIIDYYMSTADNVALMVLGFTDFKNGDKVKSVSTGKLVITYRDLFNNTKVRTYDIKRFEKE